MRCVSASRHAGYRDSYFRGPHTRPMGEGVLCALFHGVEHFERGGVLILQKVESEQDRRERVVQVVRDAARGVVMESSRLSTAVM